MNVLMLLASFGGGAFGALVGALPSFILTGAICIVGAGISMAGGSDLIVNNIAFGPFLSPHIAFAGGAAAAAYAGNVRKTNKVKVVVNELEIGQAQEIDGADVSLPLNITSDYTVLMVGGIFGVLGYIINHLYANIIGFETDTVAMTVITSAVITRLLLGRSGLTGKFEGEGNRKYFSTGDELIYNVVIGATLGIVVSCMGVYLIEMGVQSVALAAFPMLCFGISTFSLVFAQTGSPVPATHHITLVGATAAINSGNPLVGIIFAIISALVGDFVSKTFNSYNDTHIDPPAAAIFICMFVVLAVF